MFLSFFCCFFFSSRRRHTRYIGDWSSDVCSSDLGSIALDLCGEPLLLEHGDQPGAQRFAKLEEVPVRPRTAKLGQGGDGRSQIGRASCRERVEIWEGAGCVEEKRTENSRERKRRA